MVPLPDALRKNNPSPAKNDLNPPHELSMFTVGLEQTNAPVDMISSELASSSDDMSPVVADVKYISPGPFWAVNVLTKKDSAAINALLAELSNPPRAWVWIATFEDMATMAPVSAIMDSCASSETLTQGNRVWPLFRVSCRRLLSFFSGAVFRAASRSDRQHSGFVPRLFRCR